MKFPKSPWFGFDAFYRLTGGQVWDYCNKSQSCGPNRVV